MLAMVIVPLVIAAKDHLSIVDGFKLITLYHFSLNIAVQGLDVSVLLRGSHLGKLLVHALLF
jgi:hypothetical protein